MTEYNLPEKDDAPWLNTTYDGFMTHEEMLEVAERRQLINEALIELDAIVLGGQNTREFYLSVSHIRNVLERLK